MGSLKDSLKENAEKKYTLDDQEFNYMKNLENVKQTLINAVDLYVNTAQMGFLQYLSSHKFGLDGGKKYQYDIDLEGTDKVVVVKEVE